MKHEVFTVEFERRLFDLRDAIDEYEDKRIITPILPRLFSCLSYCWCRYPTKMVNSVSVPDKVTDCFPDVNHLLDDLEPIEDDFVDIPF